MNAQTIRLVCGTRVDSATFHATAALGRSLAMYSFLPSVELRLFDQNVLGLSTIYNVAIREAEASPATLVFIHDDVFLSDFSWAHNVAEGLKSFDIIGITGNKRRTPRQPSWAFVDENFNWDLPENLSGIVGNGSAFPCTQLNAYGQPNQEVKILDGLFLACQSRILLESDLFFDEQFDFDFYDIDFCRQAEQKGLRMGTWRISVIHESAGKLGTPGWIHTYHKYLDKWCE